MRKNSDCSKRKLSLFVRTGFYIGFDTSFFRDIQVWVTKTLVNMWVGCNRVEGVNFRVARAALVGNIAPVVPFLYFFRIQLFAQLDTILGLSRFKHIFRLRVWGL